MNTLENVRSPAEIYDTHFVPALFAHWGPVVAAEAGVKKGDRVLDVACGTGALTLAVADIVGTSGSVVGLDANPEMLAVARRKPVQIEWLEGTAEALREMMRVLRRGGGLAVAVCDAVENSPGYGAFAQLLDRLFGRDVGDAFRAPFSLGDTGRLREICREAEIAGAEVVQCNEKVRFRSIDAMVSTERACVWTLGGLLTDEQFGRLLAESDTAMRPFLVDGGAIEFDMPSLIIRARKG